jgi:homoserine kinase
MSQKSVIVQAPASTSNCGPGFDTLSIALSLYNFIRVSLREDAEILGASSVNPAAQAMVEETALSFEQAAGLEIGGFDYDIWGEVPIARGLGSSSTLRAGIIAGLNELTGQPLDQESMIRLTTRLDHAPDNACAVFAGGFCIARTEAATGAYREHVRFDLPEDLIFAVVSPDYEVLTEQSRDVLPESIPFHEVVQSANSLAYLVGVMVSGDFRRLSGAIEDHIHQPYRELLNPFGRESIAAGSHAGAYAGWLSGSGSSVACACDAEHCSGVLREMQSVYEQNAISSRAFRLVADNRGLTFQ